MAAVSLEHVTKLFAAKAGPVRAVDDLCIDVADHEFAVLVGPSGCGKTTTLRLVAGLEEPDAGLIRIGERTVNHVPPKDRDVAMVFQNYALYPHMTVFGNMAFGLKMRRVPKGEIKRKVEEVAALLGIEHLLARKPAALSGGERQRVAVGRAIVRRPRVFLFDEPLSNLDARLRTRMRAEIKSLHRELNTTIIYVTHDQEEAMTLGDRLVIMDRGVAQQCGTPLEVYERPANRFVAGFVGTPPMNLLEGRLEADGTEAKLFFTLTGGQARLSLPKELGNAVRPHVGRMIVLGIRPQELCLAGGDAMPTGSGKRQQPVDHIASISASVTLLEPLGDSITVHLVMAGGTPAVARVAPSVTLFPGQKVDLAVDMSRVQFFSADECGSRLA